jgi:hypothetical protein
MGTPLYDEDGSRISGQPYVPQPPRTAKERSLANLKRGRPGRQSQEVVHLKDFMRTILDDPHYRASYRRRMKSGEIAPQLEAMAYHYILGKPKETVDIHATVGVTTINLEHLTDAQLQAMRELLQGIPQQPQLPPILDVTPRANGSDDHGDAPD